MKHLITTIIFLLCINLSKANNIQISNISLVPANSSIKFDLSWDNSWRSNILNNWDAAYIFFKYKGPGGVSLTIAASGANNILPAGFTRVAYSTGTIIHRSLAGNGTSTLTNVEIGIVDMNGLLFSGGYDIKAFAIEMVYIPTGTFQLGDGSTNSYTPTIITSAASQYILDPLVVGGFNITQPLNGYNAFYCMKYELSQGGYRDFLNSLSYAQQATHVTAVPNAAAGTAALYNSNRNYIKIKTPGLSPIGAVFGCDANGNGVYDEAADGEWVACNFVNWIDHAAYLAWAGLKPMTEMQYEKAARGTQSGVPGEFAWGNAQLSNSLIYTLSNASQSSEIASNASLSPIGNSNFQVSFPNLPAGGPLRNGIFATTASDRISSGGSYYGVMELSGNLWERVITSANSEGRDYFQYSSNIMTSNLNEVGFATTGTDQLSAYWPGEGGYGIFGFFTITGTYLAKGLIYRGGGWYSNVSTLRTSDRGGLLVINNNTDRTQMSEVGIRGVLIQ
jgi:formylglycine-generating enzyme required for sulfatase activity